MVISFSIEVALVHFVVQFNPCHPNITTTATISLEFHTFLSEEKNLEKNLPPYNFPIKLIQSIRSPTYFFGSNKKTKWTCDYDLCVEL